MPIYKAKNKETGKIVNIYGDNLADTLEFIAAWGLEDIYDLLEPKSHATS